MYESPREVAYRQGMFNATMQQLPCPHVVSWDGGEESTWGVGA